MGNNNKETNKGNSACKFIDVSKMSKTHIGNFIDVDVWRTQFGSTSVSAIFSVYSKRFGVSPKTMKHDQRRYSFQHCLNALRKLENPSYEPPQDIIIY